MLKIVLLRPTLLDQCNTGPLDVSFTRMLIDRIAGINSGSKIIASVVSNKRLAQVARRVAWGCTMHFTLVPSHSLVVCYFEVYQGNPGQVRKQNLQ